VTEYLSIDWRRASVGTDKLVGYLLNSDHKKGAAKAAFFRRFGYAEATLDLFAKALIQHAENGEIAASFETPFGVQVAVEGEFRGLAGETRRIRSIWMVVSGRPRLVSAYPLGRAG
jgi:hypothetical protein